MPITKFFLLCLVLCVSLGLVAQELPDRRIATLFADGIPKEALLEYYESGTLKTLYYPYKKKYKHNGLTYNYGLYIDYYRNGNYLRYTDDRIGFEQTFEATGELTSYLIYNRKKNKLTGYVEFFPGKSKKTVISNGKRLEYDENERLKRSIEQKSIRYEKKTGITAATFYFEEYDATGNVSRSGRFYTLLIEKDDRLRLKPEFPSDLDSVPIQDYKEVFYPQLNIKDVFFWDFSNRKTLVTRFERQGDGWKEIRKESFPRQPNDGISFFFEK